MAKRRFFILILAGVGMLTQPVWAQKHPDYEIDFSKSRFDSTTIALCNRFISTPLQIAIASAKMDPRLVPAFVDAEDYPSDTSQPYLKFIYASDGQFFSELLTLRRLDNGDYEFVDRTQSTPPGHRVRLRCRDVTGDGKQELISTSRGGQPSRESMMVFEIDSLDLPQPISFRPQGPYDINGLHGVAVAIFDSLGRNGAAAIEVWMDDSLHFAAQYTRVRHQYDPTTKKFVVGTVDTLPQLPPWCDGRRAMYIPQR
ncbi:MAG: hypothetical protein Kow0074_18030 [Candidatus Zixiibacteriota bacterium]